MNKNSVKVKFLNYDWGTNSSRHVPFHHRVLTNTENSFQAVLKPFVPTKEEVIITTSYKKLAQDEFVIKYDLMKIANLKIEES